tara:strand:+ start:203 stop:550 length:348 start_codon:yes stop_codon:yes gene_type:complete
MNFNSDFRYDLQLGQLGEKYLNDILSYKKIEVKTDLQYKDTGNIYIEYESRKKPSGIATTQSEWYAIVLSKEKIILITTDKLKDLCRKYIGTEYDKRGGDKNTSKGICIPIKKIL